jgi:hypothetical protein
MYFRVLVERKNKHGVSLYSGTGSKFERIEVAINAADLRWADRKPNAVSVRVVGSDGATWYEVKA